MARGRRRRGRPRKKVTTTSKNDGREQGFLIGDVAKSAQVPKPGAHGSRPRRASKQDEISEHFNPFNFFRVPDEPMPIFVRLETSDDEMSSSASANQKQENATIQDETALNETIFNLPYESIPIDDTSEESSSDKSSEDDAIFNVSELGQNATPMVKFLESYKKKVGKQTSLAVYLRRRILQELPVYGRLNYHVKIEAFKFEYNICAKDDLRKYECDILYVAILNEPDCYYLDIHMDEILEYYKEKGGFKWSWKKIGTRDELDWYILQHNNLILKEFRHFYRLTHFIFNKTARVVLNFVTQKALTSRDNYEMYLKKRVQKNRFPERERNSESNKKWKCLTNIEQESLDEYQNPENIQIGSLSPEPSFTQEASNERTSYSYLHYDRPFFMPFVEKMVREWKIQSRKLAPD